MVGQGVLRECLQDPRVEHVLLVVRHATSTASPKLTRLVQENFFDWTSVEDQFNDYDACFFCLGVSAVGMNEAAYRRITYDLTLSVAEVLVRRGVITQTGTIAQSGRSGGRPAARRRHGGGHVVDEQPG